MVFYLKCKTINKTKLQSENNCQCKQQFILHQSNIKLHCLNNCRYTLKKTQTNIPYLPVYYIWLVNVNISSGNCASKTCLLRVCLCVWQKAKGFTVGASETPEIEITESIWVGLQVVHADIPCCEKNQETILMLTHLATLHTAENRGQICWWFHDVLWHLKALLNQ